MINNFRMKILNCKNLIIYYIYYSTHILYLLRIKKEICVL